MVPNESKRCTKCGEVKPLADYFKCSFDPRYKNQNRRMPACKACKVRAAVDWARRNKDKRRVIHARWAAANPDKVVASCAKYYRGNLEKARAGRQVRRARIRGSEGEHGEADLLRIYDAQDGKCYYCAVPLHGDYHIDHMTPLSRGGSNWPENICCACATCNLRKNKRTADEFLAILARKPA